MITVIVSIIYLSIVFYFILFKSNEGVKKMGNSISFKIEGLLLMMLKVVIFTIILCSSIYLLLSYSFHTFIDVKRITPFNRNDTILVSNKEDKGHV